MSSSKLDSYQRTYQKEIIQSLLLTCTFCSFREEVMFQHSRQNWTDLEIWFYSVLGPRYVLSCLSGVHGQRFPCRWVAAAELQGSNPRRVAFARRHGRRAGKVSSRSTTIASLAIHFVNERNSNREKRFVLPKPKNEFALLVLSRKSLEQQKIDYIVMSMWPCRIIIASMAGEKRCGNDIRVMRLLKFREKFRSRLLCTPPLVIKLFTFSFCALLIKTHKNGDYTIKRTAAWRVPSPKTCRDEISHRHSQS